MTTSPPTDTPLCELNLQKPDHLQAQEERACSISIIVNGQPHTTTARTLQEWVDAQDAAPTALATAVNGTFVPRTARAQHVLHEGDAVLTFQPIQGG
jgi:sulfur carrier protein